MEKRKAKIAVQVVGWVFLVTGIVGLFLPFLQGILFILIGLAILSSHYLWADKILTKAKKRYPKLADQLDGIMLKLRKRF